MSARNFRRALLIALLVFGVGASPARAALSYYVHISTIPGESTAPNHEGWIEAFAISAGVADSIPYPSPSPAPTPSHPSLSSVNILKALDKASVKLAKAVAAGTALGDVTLEVVDSASTLPVYHILLHDAFVETCELSGSSELPIESISIAFGAIEWTYTYQPDNSAFTAYWDSINVIGGPGPLPTPTPAAQQDGDGDGMPDAYEMANGLNPLLNDALGDKDGDGVSNINEYLSGTLANDATSVFRVHGISRGNGTMLLTWSSVANRTYSIRKGATPIGPWANVQSGILSFEGETSRNVPFTGTSLFFQVTTP